MLSILIIASDKKQPELIQEALANRYSLKVASSGEEALKELKKKSTS